MQVRALGAPCGAYASGFSTTHVSGAVIEAATDAEMEAIMTDIGIPAALRVQFRLIFAKWKEEGGKGVDEVGGGRGARGGRGRFLGSGGFGSASDPALLSIVSTSPDLREVRVTRPHVPAKTEIPPMKRKCGECFGQGHVGCPKCRGEGVVVALCHKFNEGYLCEYKQSSQSPNCQHCDSPVKTSCRKCQGKGRILCEACDATGFQR